MEKLEKIALGSKQEKKSNKTETENNLNMKAKLHQLFAFFRGKDKEIAVVEQIAQHVPMEQIEEIKEDIGLEEELAAINSEAERLEKEAEVLEAKEVSPSEEYIENDLSQFLKVAAKGKDIESFAAELRLEAEKKLSKKSAKGENREEIIEGEMKRLLLDRCHRTISDEEKYRKGKIKKGPSKGEVIRAKVITLATGETKPLEKYYSLGYEEHHRALFSGYLNLNRYYSSNEDDKIDADSVNLLLAAGFKDDFLKLSNDERTAAISEYGDGLIEAIIDSYPVNKLDRLYDELRFVMEYRTKECSRAVYEKMIACGASYYVINHLDKFQKEISPTDLEDLSRRYSCSYPYMIDNLFAGIDSTSWTEEEKLEARRHVLKHQNITDSNIRYYFDREGMEEFKEISVRIKELDLLEDIEGMKRELEAGHLPYFQECRNGFSTLLKSDPEFVVAQAARYNQENLILHRIEGEERIALSRKYADKLFEKGDFDIIFELEKKGGLEGALNKDIYIALAERYDYAPALHSAEIIDDNVMDKYLQHPAKAENIFQNSSKLQLKEERFKPMMEYKEMVGYVCDFFKGVDGKLLFEKLNLRPAALSEEKFIDFKKHLDDNVASIAKFLGKKVENADDKTEFIEFLKGFGLDALRLPTEELDLMLREAKSLPSTIVKGRSGRFRETLTFVCHTNLLAKTKFIEELKTVTDFFGGSRQDFLNYFLLQKGINSPVNIESRDLFDTAFKLSDRFTGLSDEQKKVLSQAVPGIESVAGLREGKVKELSALDQEKVGMELKYSFSKLVKKWQRGDLNDFCGYVGAFGNTPFPVLFSVYKEIIKTEPEEFSAEVKNTLKRIGINFDESSPKESLLDNLSARVKELTSDQISASSDNDSESYPARAFTAIRLEALKGEKQDPKYDFAASFFKQECRASDKSDPDKFTTVDYSALIEKIPDNTWAMNLWLYINGKEGHFGNNAEEMTKPFDDTKYRDQVLTEFKKEWLAILEGGNNRLNLKLDTICSSVDYYGGAGNLKHVESLSNLMICMRDHAWSDAYTTLRTKREIQATILEQEKRFEKEKWTQDACSEFYNLSADIIEAAPSLYSAFKPVFERLNGKEMKQFARELLPLYQAKLVALQSVDGGQVKYKPKDLVEMRNYLTGLAGLLEVYPEDKQENLAEHKQELLEDLKMRFKGRFGINKIPDEMNKESIRTISDCIRYLGNISKRNKKTEALISLYLSLGLNNEWKDFRAGKNIDLNEYLVEGNVGLIQEIIERRGRENKISCELVNISVDEEAEFQNILQAEVSSSMLGSVQTIDDKLLNLKSNIQDLGDPDAFPDQTDKKLLEVCRSGPKNLNSLLAKIYGETAGKPTTYSDSEKTLKEQLENIFSLNRWDGSMVKKIQDRAQPMSLIFNLLGKMESEQLDQKVSNLRDSLLPSTEVVEIFNRLEEGFKPESGAYALFRDLEYLEGLVVKADEKLSEQDKQKVESYLAPIREQMAGLETLMSRVKEHFAKLSVVAEKGGQPLLQQRLEDVKKAFESGQGESLIQSYLVNDLNLIIENMRQCLGCLRKEYNNDTNLSFGDYNKFFLMSRQGKEEGSIADQIVYLVPVKNMQTGKQDLNFVLDRLYGDKTSDLLVAHTLAVHKKYAALKEKFKEANLGLVVSQMALQSVGIHSEDFIKKVKDKLGQEININFENELIADVKESALSDHYVEFADIGGGRLKGEINFSGIRIKM